MRIDKYLTKAGIAKRSEVKQILTQYGITVNGNKITDCSYNVTLTDEVFATINGEKVQLRYEEYIYLMINKPSGYVCATIDNLHETILSLIDNKTNRDLHIVGRLDIDTEGLLLISDDGAFVHQITSPKRAIPKKYYVEYTGILDIDDISKLKKGITLSDGTIIASATLEPIDDNKAFIIITEGKFHEVKRIFNAINLSVTYLKRVQIGDLVLDANLKIGEYRKLTNDEKDQCMKSLN